MYNVEGIIFLVGNFQEEHLREVCEKINAERFK